MMDLHLPAEGGGASEVAEQESDLITLERGLWRREKGKVGEKTGDQ